MGRRKRFFADVRMPDGEEIVAHCPNPGSMRGNNLAGLKVWIQDRKAAGGKLAYRWVAVDRGAFRVGIDTSQANHLVAEALAAGEIAELRAYSERIPEFTIEDSRLDFLLGSGFHEMEDGLRLIDTPCFVEVKSVSMVEEDGVARFPDSVTERGRKHLELLAELALSGHRAVLLFLVATDGVERMGFADSIDPKYGEAVRAARDLGVEVIAYSSRVDAEGWSLGRKLAIEW